MNKQQVLEHFGGTSAVAKVLQISPAAVSLWPDPIPKGRAYELETVTKGQLKVDLSLYQKPNQAA
ncbi:Cro/CI family transcriptional regulator [Aliidiomarina maris]|uniref:DNA-binding transcriptional regulator Cro n=1 Tax=Aliidiomarina maris TaxID=531312 RepID=A0A327X4Q9_9GAMM|nr:Cro/CI family transcriptional regulator [Aliidiomarina maris]RAK01629.1 DNA-binding transcriptional regulator Cro [Aliidiomarina maris]RUO28454.1 hypothetical protein CWE07_01205 [Aliidiomarina maris]